MDEQKIRQIVKEEIDRNYRSGSPSVPPHIHDGVSNSPINATNIVGAQTLSAATKNQNGIFTYGVISPFSLNIDGSVGTLIGPNSVAGGVFSFPLPIIKKTGGSPNQFRGGDAPDGTAIIFYDADALTFELWVMVDTIWRGVTLDLT